jgi:hypothetical protein
MKRTTREWVQKAEDDYRAAVKLNRGSDPLHDQTCFLCQQCAEKYLKALMGELSLPIPRTHILKDLLTLLQPHHRSLAPLRRGLGFLTRFAVDIRVSRPAGAQAAGHGGVALGRQGTDGGADDPQPPAAPAEAHEVAAVTSPRPPS